MINQRMDDTTEAISIAAELGESFEYGRTLVSSQIELAKIEGIQFLSKIAGGAILLLLLLLSGCVLVIGLSILACMYLVSLLGSVYAAVGIVLLVHLVTAVVLVALREKVIYGPIRKVIYSTIDTE